MDLLYARMRTRGRTKQAAPRGKFLNGKAPFACVARALARARNRRSTTCPHQWIRNARGINNRLSKRGRQVPSDATLARMLRDELAFGDSGKPVEGLRSVDALVR
jgi:hypothetical protein